MTARKTCDRTTDNGRCGRPSSIVVPFWVTDDDGNLDTDERTYCAEHSDFRREPSKGDRK